MDRARKIGIVGRSLSALACVLSLSVARGAEPLETILERIHEARGGLVNLKAVRTARMSGRVAQVGNAEGAFLTIEWKRPNKLRVTLVSAQGVAVQAFDGRMAWVLAPSRAEAQVAVGDQAAAIRRQADLIEGPLVDWQAKGHVVEYVGQTTLDGKPVHELKLKRADEPEQAVFVDARTFLPLRYRGSTVSDGATTGVVTSFGAYSRVGPLMMAHTVKTELVDARHAQTVTLDTIELDVELADEQFTLPAPAPSDEVSPAAQGGAAKPEFSIFTSSRRAATRIVRRAG